MRALLFDLDGTLLPFDHERFMKGYFQKLVPAVAEVVDPQRIVGQIWRATEAMIANEDPDLTNEAAFRRAFFADTNYPEDVVWDRFNAFYESGFPELEALTEPTPISREICRIALDKGYQVVLATNPIFPDAAVRHRMRWAGIDDIPFTLVTTMEHMHYCKPSPKYYMEILERLDLAPYECIMIGNDVQEDGVAGKLGMETFLVTDCLIDRGVGHVEFTHRGTLQDVLRFVQELPVRREAESADRVETRPR
ncbi:MAG: HAD family hydrolase [Alicyclobacillus sp.]|nr:HAD family hydrolase [Alicyclobacillus sp.]